MLYWKEMLWTFKSEIFVTFEQLNCIVCILMIYDNKIFRTIFNQNYLISEFALKNVLLVKVTLKSKEYEICMEYGF